MKKILSFALATALCLAMLPTSALAASQFVVPAAPGEGQHKEFITISAADTSGVSLGAQSFQVRNWNTDVDENGLFFYTKTEAETLALDSVYALPMGSKLVIGIESGYIPDDWMSCQAWSDPDGDGVYDSRRCKVSTVEDEEGLTANTEMLPADTAGPLQQTLDMIEDPYSREETSYNSFWTVSCEGTIDFFTMGFGGGIEGGTTEIYTNYLVSLFGPNTLVRLDFERGMDEKNYNYLHGEYYFLLTGEPDAPRTAVPTSSTVTVNGVPTAFDAYNIDGNNYFKLRDVAFVLNGTEKQFGVDWDAAANSITLLYDTPYTPVGGAMAPGTGAAQTAISTSSAVLMYGDVQSLEAYNIGGNNYFKLRDLGRLFDFGVDWDAASNTVVIDTSKFYY